MSLQKLASVVLGGLDNLNLADEDVLQGVDALALLLDLLADHLRDELNNEILQVGAGRLAGHDLEHLLANLADLRALGVSSLPLRVGALLGEGDGEQAQAVAVGGVDLNERLDEGLPAADERLQLVGGEVQAVEGGEGRAALDVLDPQADLLVCLVLVLLEVGEGSLNDAALQSIRSDL